MFPELCYHSKSLCIPYHLIYLLLAYLLNFKLQLQSLVMLLHMQIMTSKTIFNSLPNIIGSQLQEDLRTSPKNGTYERLKLVTESLLEPLITANNQCFKRPKATTIVIFNGLNSSVRSRVLKRFLFVYKHGQCHSTKP